MQALINTIQSYFEKVMSFFSGFWNFIKAIFKSVFDFLTDLPALILKQVFDAILWVLDQIAALLPADGSTFNGYMTNALSSLDPAVLYCLDRSNFATALSILGLGLSIWSAMRVLKFIRG